MAAYPRGCALTSFNGKQPSIAVVLHLYYEQQWPELATLIRMVPSPFTLFVTILEFSPAEAMIRAEFPHAIIRTVPNLGRDVLPFITVLPELLTFDLVCKIHTKRNSSNFRPGRIEALRGVLGGPRLIELILATFREVPELMMVGSGASFLDGWGHLYGAKEPLLEIVPELPKRFGFFASTMFWMRPAIFADFVERFPASRFVPHQDQDGHLEHAIERLFGVRVAELNGEIGLTKISVGVPIVDVMSVAHPAVEGFGIRKPRLRNRYQVYPPDWYLHPEYVERAPMGEFPPLK